MYCVVDLDGTLCNSFYDEARKLWDYMNATPRYEVIDIINSLYDKGHHITIYTARGSTSGKDWKEPTERQLKVWGVKYHRLLFNKPAGELYIDDRTISPEFLVDKWPLLEGIINAREL